MFGDNYDTTNNNTELMRRVADCLDLDGVAMNEVDLDDIAVSSNILQTLYRAVDNFYSGRPRRLNDTPLVSAYWIDDTRELVLCAASLGGLHLVRVPEKSWTLKEPSVIH